MNEFFYASRKGERQTQLQPQRVRERERETVRGEESQ